MLGFVATSILTLPLLAGVEALWKDINVGMSYSEVQALYPAVKGKVHHRKTSLRIESVAKIGSCSPDVEVYFTKEGIVRAVWMSSRQRGLPSTTCVTDAETALLSKYGKPLAESTGDDTYVWRRDGMLVRFKRYPGSDESWTIIYQVAAPSDV